MLARQKKDDIAHCARSALGDKSRGGVCSQDCSYCSKRTRVDCCLLTRWKYRNVAKCIATVIGDTNGGRVRSRGLSQSSWDPRMNTSLLACVMLSNSTQCAARPLDDIDRSDAGTQISYKCGGSRVQCACH